VVTARKDRDTPPPMGRPETLAVTQLPTLSPTMYPTTTDKPTLQPTVRSTPKPHNAPSHAPSVVPTSEPSMKTTKAPTITTSSTSTNTTSTNSKQASSNSTTNNVTDEKESNATIITTTAKTSSAQATTSKSTTQTSKALSSNSSASDLLLALPQMVVTVTLEPGTAWKKATAVDQFNYFFSDVVASTNSNETKLHDLEVGYYYEPSTGKGIFHINGNAEKQKSSSLQKADMDDALVTFFSYFGVQKMRTYLEEEKLPVLSLLVSVGGTVFQESENEPASLSATLGNSPAYDAPPSDSNRVDPTVLVATVVSAAAAVILLAALLMMRQRRPMHDDNKSHTDARTMEKCPSGSEDGPVYFPSTPTECAPPMPPSPPRPESVLSDDVRSYSGLVSLEDSLFTSDNSFIRGPSSSFQYDASRLDQVIISAKGLSKELDSALKRQESPGV
jgi:hypothetical protein